jgi:tetratricopeptide (TPR) repeat protein
MKLYFAAAAAALLASMPVHAASVISVGLKPAQECAIAAAKSDALTRRQTNNALAACNEAVAGDLSHVAMAGTLVNRGLVLASAGRADAAMADYDAAIAQDPRLASAYITRGAALLHTARYDAARADFNQAIALGGDNLHLAYFNRGEAQESAGNLVAAYHDYRKAQELAPAFKPASIELARFQVNERRVATIR